ncbi:DASH family cryptochrome [Vibrio splendidus]|uniref:Cryptochrome DASH n=1 Tax=Vibrio splendidus TaxID=29497 RepID=A0A2N7JSD4_VIBSP|nr:DASH family cryptochrome [Vibrio splendidus]PMM58050.1 FAD-binding protein [Vibrio splendidus]
MKKIGLYLFTNDLRIEDNALLHKASQFVSQLTCVVIEPHLSAFAREFAKEHQYGAHRAKFISQSIIGLESRLANLGHKLVVLRSSALTDEEISREVTLSGIIKSQHVTHLFVSNHCGFDERKLVQSTHASFPNLIVYQQHHSTLFELEQLPFELSKLPRSFTKFRQLVEHLPINTQSPIITKLPPAPEALSQCHSIQQTDRKLEKSSLNVSNTNGSSLNNNNFKGGEQAGLAHLHDYFSHPYAHQYKQTRNAFDGKENSTKFSPWLALGCVSPKTIYRSLVQFEAKHGSNDSTYWIFFELLWREYFYWKCLSKGPSLFQNGTDNQNIDSGLATNTTQQNFANWKCGNTGYPIVDACMRQLNATGYMSNRGRQLTASCLIYELGVDWRNGAAYFESQLVDYDVASNWGNWAYIAGDLNQPVHNTQSLHNTQSIHNDKSKNQTQPKSRHFDLAKQTERYDPDHAFINQWKETDQHTISASKQDKL